MNEREPMTKETIRDVVSTMTEKQKTVMYWLIGKAIAFDDPTKFVTMSCEWAEHEIELAIKREIESATEDGAPDDASYGMACYKSALRAYKALYASGHTGMSIALTQEVLDRLIENKPLTAIEDIEDDWSFTHSSKDNIHVYQNKRFTALFKNIMPDGHITFDDVNRVTCINVEDNSTWHSGLADRVVNEYFPITFPYWPEKITVRMQEYLAYERGGDYDTVHIISIEYYDKAKKEHIIKDVNRYFAEDDSGEFIEIPVNMFVVRRQLAEILRNNKNNTSN